MAAIDRTAYPRFKRVLPSRELAEAFTPTDGELACSRAKTEWQRGWSWPTRPGWPACWVDPTSRRSQFDRLKAPTKAATPGRFKLRLAHLLELDALGPTEA
ncbi:hypothetical protein M8C13_38210 [Crossiella sp. SN42]|uniref:hypothetical protein n=1 Tax=Crossiella sp. SN42 TaxID=2944808 RepID=UPI00207C33DF|nr:hypothetical protein [Crossiella sp. SN42]MCO1581600.1 hypothetical protein [Crossiella sp. SN42]